MPKHPVVLNPHILLTSIPTGSTFFTGIDLCSAFFSIPVDETSQYLFPPHLGRKKIHLHSNISEFTESSTYFLQILKADLDDKKFPRGSTLLQYVDDLLLCSPSQAPSQEDSSHLLKLLALKGHKVSKEKLQFAQTQFRYLGHLLSEQGLYPDPDRFHDVLSFLKPQTKSTKASWLLLKLDSEFPSYGLTSLVCFTK